MRRGGSPWSLPEQLPQGANYGAPLKYEVSKTSDEVVAAQREIAAAISAASTVAIVGGGPNGLEIAFEITEKYGKTKTVTLIHAGEKLLDRVAGLDPKVPQVALERCKEAGIEVILGERAELSDGLRFKGWAAQQTLKTDKGREIQADVVLAVTGNSGFNSSPLKSLNPNVITAKGDIDTLPTLQIKGFPHMFAFGDVSSQSVNKQAAETSFQLSTLVANLKAVVSGKPATKEVKPSSDAFIVVSMGSKGGFGQTPFGVLSGKVGGWMIKQIKGKDLFLTNAWKTYTGAGIPA